jgi:uncharacterized protein with PQ loop repeat
MMNPEFFAAAGGILLALAFLPQFKKIQYTNNVDSFCPNAICLKLFGSLFLMYYSWVKKLPIIFIGSTFGFLFDVYILIKIKSQKV